MSKQNKNVEGSDWIKKVIKGGDEKKNGMRLPTPKKTRPDKKPDQK